MSKILLFISLQYASITRSYTQNNIPVQNEAHSQHPSSSSRMNRFIVDACTFLSHSLTVDVIDWPQNNVRKKHL